MLFDVLLSFSTRWREIDFTSWSPDIPPSMIRIAALTAVDLPLLQSVSLCFRRLRSNIVFHDSELLKLPTLRQVSLNNDSQMFTINCGHPHIHYAPRQQYLKGYWEYFAENPIPRILQYHCIVFRRTSGT